MVSIFGRKARLLEPKNNDEDIDYLIINFISENQTAIISPTDLDRGLPFTITIKIEKLKLLPLNR